MTGIDLRAGLLSSSHLVTTFVILAGAYLILACPSKDSCLLPDCYSCYLETPGNLTAKNTPQMVLFTYTGAITKKTKKAIMKIFPDSLTNPNKCPIGVTLFVVSQGSDSCGTYRLYYRGHEIALAGMNKTNWMPLDWGDQIQNQLQHLSETSHVDPDDIVGFRAQRLKPGGDEQFKVLQNNMFVYDSSLLDVSHRSTDNHIWPFTLDKGLANINITCLNPSCPKESYPGLWEVMTTPMTSQRAGIPRACTYLDDCARSLKSSHDVSNLLKNHFLELYNGNRAPLQVNLQPRSLEVKMVVAGLKDFVRFVLSSSDSWIVTNQDAIKWMQHPMPTYDIADSGLWDCPDRGDYVRCHFENESNTTYSTASFSTIMEVEILWIWQTLVLVILFFILYQCDRKAS